MSINVDDINLDDFNPTDDEIRHAAKRKVLSEGFYAAIAENPNRKVADSGSLMIQFEWFPLENRDDRESKTTPAQRDSLILPIANKAKEGHEIPGTMTMVASKLRGMYGTEVTDDGFGVPYYPRQDKATKEWSYQGEVISEDEVEDLKLQVNKRTIDCSRRLWQALGNNEDPISGTFAYIKVGPERKGFVNVDYITQTLPDEAELVEPPFGVK